MIRRALTLAALGAALLAPAAAHADDYLATGGSVFTSLRPTGVGLPQIGETGTVGAGDLPSALRTYHDGGQYDKDLASVAGAAQDYLDARLNGESDADAAAGLSTSSGGGSAGTQGGATGGGAGSGSGSTTTAGAGGRTTKPAGTKCTTKYVRIKRAKGRAALYKRKVTCPKAKKKTTVKRSAAAKPAIVLDIDETSLSNYSGLVASNFSSAGTAIPAAAGTGTAIAPTLALYKDARARGVAVFFVTGRPSLIDAATQSNLKSAGYSNGWDGLQYKPTDQGTEAFKSAARAAIEARGYEILLNMGDQESDLDGGHADRAFKLPNPYYFIAD